MQKLFTKILVPIVVNRHTRWHVDKAVQLANKFDCDIFLLHIQIPSLVSSLLPSGLFNNTKSIEQEVTAKFRDWEIYCKSKLKESLTMYSGQQDGDWQAAIKNAVITEHIDLVLIPTSHKHLFRSAYPHINVNKLSQHTRCPIMTITRNFNVNNLKGIVVPVCERFPANKLAMATYLSLETDACIYLIGKDEPTNENRRKGNLLKAYQVLNDFGRLNIQCALQDDNSGAGSTLTFAKNVNANLIVVNPGNESRLKRSWNKLRGKHLSRESDIPVLTVAF
jgi:hypothetical protein